MAKKQSSRRSSPARKPQGSGGQWFLYPLTLVVGGFVGVQAYSHFLQAHASEARRPEGETALRQTAVPARTTTSSHRPRAGARGDHSTAARHPDRDPDAPPPASGDTSAEQPAAEKSDPPNTAAGGDVSVHSLDPAGSLPNPARMGDADTQPGGTPSGMRETLPGGQPAAPRPPVRTAQDPARPSGDSHSTETVNPSTPAPSAGPLPSVEIDRGSGKRPEVALTFDAGSDWKPVKLILDTLATEGVKCTFFLTGEWVSKNPKTAAKIAAQGHELGNHSWNHPPFTDLKDPAIRDQLRRTEDLVKETLGKTTHPYFRPPLGARDGRVRRVVADEGYLTIYWTLDSRDSVDKGITAQQIRDRVLAGVKPGSIVLMHCGSEPSAEALSEILKGLKSKGLTPVTVSRLLSR